MEQKQTNYALISALYENGKKGLYSDIYFPIIKYSIVSVYSHNNSAAYFNTSDVQQFIIEHFGITIPTIVISKTIIKIDSIKSPSFDLIVYENGMSFKINYATFEHSEVDVIERESQITNDFEVIEAEYKQYIENEGLVNDDVSFINFISDNTDDILGYFENEDTTKVDEKYTTIVFFLQYLHRYNKNLYNTANRLFWASIIAAFLKSTKPIVNSEIDGVSSEYYLDTSIILGLLKLSTPEREEASKNLFDTIKSSGSEIMVNPFTMEEISMILTKVEQGGPNPLTSIASAYERYSLNANRLAEVRIGLRAKLEGMGIRIHPNPMSKQAFSNTVREFKEKKTTKLLGELRSKKTDSYSSDNFRDVHDIYMDSYIQKLRNDGKLKTFFVTSNNDLISFCRAQHPDNQTMICPNRVILELWMHNMQPVESVTGGTLTETMARCLDLHSSRVQKYISDVSRLYNQTKDGFNPEIYKDFIQKLYKRAKNVITSIETPTDDNWSNNEIGKLIAEAVSKDNLHYDETLAKSKKERDELAVQIEHKKQSLQEKDRQYDQLKEEQDNNEKRIAELGKDLSNAQNTIKALEKDKEKADDLVELYRERDELAPMISNLKANLVPLQLAREKCFRNWIPWTLGICAAILVITIIVVYALINFEFLDSKWNLNSFMVIPVALFAACWGVALKSQERKDNAIKKWERDNPKYNRLCEDLANKENRLNDINKALVGHA